MDLSLSFTPFRTCPTLPHSYFHLFLPCFFFLFETGFLFGDESALEEEAVAVSSKRYDDTEEWPPPLMYPCRFDAGSLSKSAGFSSSHVRVALDDVIILRTPATSSSNGFQAKIPTPRCPTVIPTVRLDPRIRLVSDYRNTVPTVAKSSRLLFSFGKCVEL